MSSWMDSDENEDASMDEDITMFEFLGGDEGSCAAPLTDPSRLDVKMQLKAMIHASLEHRQYTNTLLKFAKDDAITNAVNLRSAVAASISNGEAEDALATIIAVEPSLADNIEIGMALRIQHFQEILKTGQTNVALEFARTELHSQALSAHNGLKDSFNDALMLLGETSLERVTEAVEKARVECTATVSSALLAHFGLGSHDIMSTLLKQALLVSKALPTDDPAAPHHRTPVLADMVASDTSLASAVAEVELHDPVRARRVRIGPMPGREVRQVRGPDGGPSFLSRMLRRVVAEEMLD
ncbi:CTLH/CRA C-terminal to LisH motif domain [Carpediemonas membranifera]|uniref:CTLH/CRA C-terminal to LisH motif domain n=1 Tax=Carpediemonas membranifera TaxID=201153 RepID=A0A8J6AV24_9EUKA|nr:CTLH/CRA C-terminal to LisH motif domain [Carpediemonas membranifera]|eukprot:KAG9393230.1 CTLH/CRA C-terminal to LisH motif domain [Carpediemonas membranifera]